MARPRMVTRTITTTKAVLLMVNKTTSQVFDKEVVMSGEFEAEEDVEKRATKLFNSAESKVVAVKTFSTEEKLYGMSEEKFIEIAEVLPPRDANSDDEATEPEDAPKTSKKSKK